MQDRSTPDRGDKCTLRSFVCLTRLTRYLALQTVLANSTTSANHSQSVTRSVPEELEPSTGAPLWCPLQHQYSLLVAKYTCIRIWKPANLTIDCWMIVRLSKFLSFHPTVSLARTSQAHTNKSLLSHLWKPCEMRNLVKRSAKRLDTPVMAIPRRFQSHCLRARMVQ